jgi:RNA polymerase sigma-70 factor, ECF subfamily
MTRARTRREDRPLGDPPSDASRQASVAERFEALRPRLLRLAYGQLGSLAEAEDVVQDAWLRLQRVDADEIRDLQGWLTTTVSRLALDTLRSARVRREAYVGPWLPEPIVRESGPEERAAVAEDVSLALLVVLESLTASERIAFVLHDVFGYAFDEVAQALESTPQAARQHASRARRAVEARRPRFPASPEQQREVIVAFGQAALEGDVAGLLSLLDPDVVFTTDGGGLVTAARKPLEGADRVARTVKALAAKGGGGVHFDIVEVNGMPGLMGAGLDGVAMVMSFTVDDRRIVAIDVQRNPEKLRRLP